MSNDNRIQRIEEVQERLCFQYHRSVRKHVGCTVSSRTWGWVRALKVGATSSKLNPAAEGWWYPRVFVRSMDGVTDQFGKTEFWALPHELLDSRGKRLLDNEEVMERLGWRRTVVPGLDIMWDPIPALERIARVAEEEVSDG